mmetsp:Transcript_17152/g.42145  ORF Transcript_17152/g.42145 Transcript_17152/m.42145 type:complete len:137 (-) Transcript_17152:105-515(-)
MAATLPPVKAADPVDQIKAALDAGASVIDLRDDNERAEVAPLDGALHVPFNIDGQAQSVRSTSKDEFVAKLKASGVLNESGDAASGSKSFVTHCKGGGRAAKAAAMLKELGFEAVNGGSAPYISAVKAGATAGSSS